MRGSFYLKLGIILCISSAVYYFYSLKSIRSNYDIGSTTDKPKEIYTTEKISFKRNDIVLAVVACGDRLQETLIMLKSALMFSKAKLNFIVVAEDRLIPNFSEKLSEWKQFTNSGFTYTVMPLTFPTESAEEWRRLFKPCASQRLFLPTILENVDSILYVDTDILFLTPVEDVWRHFRKMNSSQMAALAPEHETPNDGWYNRFARHFRKMNSSQMAALAPEHETPNDGWYNRFARHPYYGPLGVNSGVMLMNLTKMRAFQWADYVVPIYKKFKLKITWGDQDIINIIFHYHPDKLYIYPCRYNYRPDHCMYMSVCKSAEQDGVAVIHGSRGFFHSEKQPVFKAIYRSFEEFQLGGDLFKEFYQPLETYLELTQNTNCGHVRNIFVKNVKKYMDIDYNDTR